MCSINKDTLLYKYLPADYIDTFEKEFSKKDEITPDKLLKMVFSNYPLWVNMLLKLRNVIVKPLGLKGGNFEDHLSDMIKCRSEQEIIIGMDDKHLAFYVSLWCSKRENDKQKISVTTIVKHNNKLGNIYFFFIKPFHKLILRSLINNLHEREQIR